MSAQPSHPPRPDPDVLELDQLEDVAGGIDDNTNKCQGNINPMCGNADNTL